MAKNLTLLNMHDMLALITDAALQRKFIKLHAPAADVDIDWNGGCNGKGAGGARYYPSGTTMGEIIPRLVMYGIARENNARRDITRGNVDGAWYQGDGPAREWYDSCAPVGFFNRKNELPNHK